MPSGPEETRPSIHPVPRSPDRATYGCSVRIASSALTRATRPPTTQLLEGAKADFVFTDPPYNVADRRPRLRAWPRPASRVRDGLRRDERGRVHGAFWKRCSGCWRRTPLTARSTRSAWIGGTCRRCSRPASGLQRTQEPLRLEQEQRRNGNVLPLQARAGVRVEERDRPTHQ